jgi:integrase
MGSVEPYSTQKGKRYRVRYRRPDHSQTTKRGFVTKRDAELFLSTVEVRKASGDYVDPRGGRRPIAELATAWLASKQRLKPSSYSVLEIAWRVHVEPRWGRRLVGEVLHSEVQNWINELSAVKSPTVVIRAHGVLAGAIDVAVRDRALRENVARGVGLPRKGRKKRAYLSHAQVEILASEARGNASLVWLLAYTGLRWGEAVALRVGAVDLARKRLIVEANAVNVRGKIVPGTPKSGEVRSVPFAGFLVDILSTQIEGRHRDDLVFGNGQTFLPTPTQGNGWFANARKRAIAIDPDFPSSLTLHDLRHTAASLAISANANVKAVQRMLGHASASMTLDTYADLFDDDLDAVATAMDQARSESIVAKMWSRPEN